MKLDMGAVGIYVNNIETMVKFYRDVIGFDIEWDGGIFAGGRMKNGTFFNLCEGEERREISLNTTFQISCGVELPHEVDTEYARLIEAGATSVIPPVDEPYGMRVCFVADPEGNQIEICAGIEN